MSTYTLAREILRACFERKLTHRQKSIGVHRDDIQLMIVFVGIVPIERGILSDFGVKCQALYLRRKINAQGH